MISDTLEQKQYCWTECVTFQGDGFEMQHALACMHACMHCKCGFPTLQPCLLYVVSGFKLDLQLKSL